MAKTKKLLASYEKIEQQQKHIMHLQSKLIKALTENEQLRNHATATQIFITKN